LPAASSAAPAIGELEVLTDLRARSRRVAADIAVSGELEAGSRSAWWSTRTADREPTPLAHAAAVWPATTIAGVPDVNPSSSTSSLFVDQISASRAIAAIRARAPRPLPSCCFAASDRRSCCLRILLGDRSLLPYGVQP
jgi:hypothetical protein